MKGMEAMMELTLTHPEFLKFSGEEVFMGSMEALLEINMPTNHYIKNKMSPICCTNSMKGK